jgi:uncharacterized membrane protein YcaP (DUF421 family)
VDWSGLFGFSVSPLELMVRGTAMYWFIFALFRLVLRRDTGSLAVADVLLLVLIADAAQNGMSGDYDSIGEGCLLVGTIAAWNVVVDWLAFRFPRLRRMLQAPPLKLVRDGRMVRANMRRELMTEDDLMAALREHGVESLAQVKLAMMESGGEISVLRRDAAETGPGARPPAGAGR